MSTAHHVSRMDRIAPTRTDASEVKYAAVMSEIAWGRYMREPTVKRKREYEAAEERFERLVDLLATQDK